jgi:hypothetical protein
MRENIFKKEIELFYQKTNKKMFFPVGIFPCMKYSGTGFKENFISIDAQVNSIIYALDNFNFYLL